MLIKKHIYPLIIWRLTSLSLSL